MAAAFAVQVLSRGVPIAAAAPLPSADVLVVSQAQPTTAALRSAALHESESDATYAVQPGDTLWSIAEQAYGSGAEYRRLVEANVGRRMPDGSVFTARGVIQPGWQLRVPQPSRQVDEDATVSAGTPSHQATRCRGLPRRSWATDRAGRRCSS